MIRDAVSPIGVGDVDLDQHQVGRVVEAERGDVLVDDLGLVVRRQIARDGRKPERRKQRVFDRAPIRTGGLGQGGQDQLHMEWSRGVGQTMHAAPFINYFTIQSTLLYNEAVR